MARNLSLIVIGIIVGLGALTMGSAVKAEYHSDLTFTPESPSLSAKPAATKHFFHPGSGIGVSPNSNMLN
jgi:hypothetical protein